MRDTDLSTLLHELSNTLTKEGLALQSLSKTWFGSDSTDYFAARQFGIDIQDAGELLHLLHKRLCNTCRLIPIKLTLT